MSESKERVSDKPQTGRLVPVLSGSACGAPAVSGPSDSPDGTSAVSGPSEPSRAAAPSPVPAAKPLDPCIRAENEDDDGYDPYSDRRPVAEPLFERDPWD